MSLWTPSGEHHVPRADTPPPADVASATGAPAPGAPPDAAALTDEDRARAEAVAREMADVREQLAAAPAAVVVANHAMGLYELAAIHLSQNPPNLGEARIAIDSFAALVATVADRLGEDGDTLHEALNQIRSAFVQLHAASQGEPADASPDSGA